MISNTASSRAGGFSCFGLLRLGQKLPLSGGAGGPSVFIALCCGLKAESHSLVYFWVAATLDQASSPIGDWSWTPQDLRPPLLAQIPHQP